MCPFGSESAVRIERRQHDDNMMTVLLIVRAFPPFLPVGHSIRAVKFIKYLPALGWRPVVLTVDDSVEYETLPKVGSHTMLAEIPPSAAIHRTSPGEPSVQFLERELAFGKRNWMTKVTVKLVGGGRRWVFRNILVPDRHITWLPSAVRRALRIASSQQLDVILVTCPPHSAALIGAILRRLTGKPLVLDFRDDWIDTPWHAAKTAPRRWLERMLEGWAVGLASRVILVTEWSRRAFQDRYPNQPGGKFVWISNGCDLEAFETRRALPSAVTGGRFRIVYAGSLNVSTHWGRSPSGFFAAVHAIVLAQPQLRNQLDVVFAGHIPAAFRQLVDEMGLSDVVRIVGPLPHSDVPQLLASADLLLAINYEGWGTLIPAKIYEYWALGGAPILLLSCTGAASEFVERYSLGFTAEPYDITAIQGAILSVFRRAKTGAPVRLNTEGIAAFNRRELAKRLAEVLSAAAAERANKPSRRSGERSV